MVFLKSIKKKLTVVMIALSFEKVKSITVCTWNRTSLTSLILPMHLQMDYLQTPALLSFVFEDISVPLF